VKIHAIFHTKKHASSRELSPGGRRKGNSPNSGEFDSGAMSSDRVECKAARNRIYVIAINGATRNVETSSQKKKNTDNCQTKDADH